MKREQIEETAGWANNKGPCSNSAPVGARSMVLRKRPRLQDFADFPALASITLTRDDLKQLDALFAGPEFFEQFSTAVSGCLLRIDRQVIGQKNHVIAQISGIVRPIQTLQVSLPNRRILINNLGYFEFDHVLQQMPDQTDFGTWIADMEMQSLPLPSDEFLASKTLALRELFSRAAANAAGRSFTDEMIMKVEEEEEGLMDGGGQGAEEANRHGFMFPTTSEMLATCSSAALKEEADSSCFMGYELDDEDGYGEDGMEAEAADRNCETVQDCFAAGLTLMAGLVATADHLRAVRIPLFMVELLAEHNAGDCLRGCLVVCHVHHHKDKTIIDEIDQVTRAGGPNTSVQTKIRFKHSRKSYLLKALKNGTATGKLFNQWIERMAKWDEPLPTMAVHKQRLQNVYDHYRQVLKLLGPRSMGQDRKKLEKKFYREMKLIRNVEQRLVAGQANGKAEQDLRQAYQTLRSSANKEGSSSFSSSSSDDDDDDEAVDETTGGELSLNEQVHTKELLNALCLPYDLIDTVVRCPALKDCLLGCFVKCRTRRTNEIIIDTIAEISPTEIRFKHSQRPFLFGELYMFDGEISTEMFIKWIENMTKWGEPLPAIMICKQQKNRAIKALKSAKEFPEGQEAGKSISQAFMEVFGRYTRRIVVDPKQLIQLLKLGRDEFKQMASGLFVRVRHSQNDNSFGTLSLEQIRTVSFDHPAYVMNGKSLTVRLHFERPAATPVPLMNVQYDNKVVEQQLIEQHAKMFGNFVPPSSYFIMKKREQLQFALNNAAKIL